MPIDRYQIRNVYSLADPELYKTADKDDPEALLEGVAMSGLVGVLRQLGDLAEFAAEIFNDLHEEVMSTAARGHGLLVRIQQLESEIPSIERAHLSQTSHSAFFPNSGIAWHPNRQTTQNLITTGDLPRFVMESFEECRAPPRLFLLDKFDLGGVGACLKRYTDPSIYKMEASTYEIESAETQWDKKIRKRKKKGSIWKGGENPEVLQPSHGNRLHQLFLEEKVQNGTIEPARRVKLKKRPNKFPFDAENGESYMNKLLNSPLEDKLVHEVSAHSSTLNLTSDATNESRLEILENSMVGPALDSAMQSIIPCVSSSVENTVSEGPTDNLSGKVVESQTSEVCELHGIQEEVDEKKIAVYEEIITDGIQNGYQSDDVASETDNYMDALTTVNSELETEATLRVKDQPQSHLSDSQSDDGNNSTENTSQVSIDLPPRPFASTEIPFCPRVQPEPVPETQNPDHEITNDSAIDSAMNVNQVEILEEVTSANEVSLNHTENLDSPRKIEEHQIDPEVTVDCTSEHSDFLSTADGLSSFSFIRNLKGDVDNKYLNESSIPMIHLPNILETTCRTSENSTSKVNEVKYSEENHIIDSVDGQCSSTRSVIIHADEPSDATFSDDIPVAEETADNSAESRVSYSTEDETESNNSEIDAVSDPADANRSRGNDCSVLIEETELDERKLESSNSEIKVGSNPLFVPDDVYRKDCKDFETLEDDTEADSANTEMETSAAAAVLQYDVDKSDNNGEKEEVDPDLENVPCDTCDVLNNDDVDILSLSSKIFQDQSHSCVAETDRKQEVITLISNVQLLENAPESTVFAEADHDLESKSLNRGDHVDIYEAERSSPLEDKVDQPNGQLNVQLPLASEASQLLFHTDHETHIDTHSEAVVQEEDLQEKPMNVVVVTHESSHLQDLQSSPEPYIILISENPPTNELLQASGHDSNLFDQVKHQSMSSDSIILQDRSHSLLPETDQSQEVVLHNLGSQPSNVKLLDSAPESTVFTEANHDLESKFLKHDNDIDIYERAESSPLEVKVDQSDGQLHDSGSQFLSQLDSMTHVDQEQHIDLHSEPAVKEDNPQGTPMYEAAQSSHLEDKVDQRNGQLHVGASQLDSLTHDEHERYIDTHSVAVVQEEALQVKTIDEAVHTSPPEDKVDQPDGQLHATDSQLFSQLDSLTDVDHKRDVDAHSEPVVQEEGPQEKPMNMVVATHESTHLQDLQSSPESYSVLVSENSPSMELLQASSNDINLFDQVKHQPTPVFSGFGTLPKLAPVKLEDMPPLPPLPPMQWRMRKLDNSLLTPTDDGQHSDNQSPPSIIPSTANEDPQLVGLSTLNEIKFPDTDNQKSGETLSVLDHEKSTVSSEAKSAESMVPQTAVQTDHSTSGQEVILPSSNPNSLHPVADEIINPDTENQKYAETLSVLNHEESTVSSEAKAAEYLVPQTAVQTDHSTSGQEVIWPSSNPNSPPPVADEMANNIRPLKIQRPRSPLIDEVASHDKSKLRKVSDRATTLTLKGEEVDKLLEQIRAKSFKLKPAVQSRPSIEGPKTNLRVAAILEKANAIRQAFAGSDDEDDDSDSWSDS